MNFPFIFDSIETLYKNYPKIKDEIESSLANNPPQEIGIESLDNLKLTQTS